MLASRRRMISHTAGETENGFLVADVWESPDDLRRFYEERLGAALQRAGVPETQPQVLPVHNHIHGSGSDGGVIVFIEIDGMTAAQYDGMTADMEAHAGDGGAHPAVSHVAVVSDDGLVVVDVWGSEAEFGSFAQSQIAPRAGDSMGQLQPRFARLHKHVPVKAPAQA